MLLDVILQYDCNYHCDFCTISDEMRTQGMDTRRVVQEMMRGRAAGAERVAFTGGEPTMRRDLIPLVAHAKRLGFESIKVQSNGLALGHRPYLDALVDAGCELLHLSPMAHTAGAHQRITGAEAAGFERLLAAVDGALERGVHLALDVIMKADTWADLPALIDFFHDRGVVDFNLWLMSLTDRAAAFPEQLPAIETLVPTLLDCFARAREGNFRVRSLHIPRCYFLRDGAIDATDLEAHLWDVLSEDAIVVTPEATFRLERSRLTANSKVPACERCQFDQRCTGLRRDYLAHHGSDAVWPVGPGSGPKA